ncbi:hypothetical protein ACWD4G_44500 [Streptomyces sp. NPDC002643]
MTDSHDQRSILISEETLDRVAHRLAEHASAKGLESVAVIPHGAEPLPFGPARLRHICAELTASREVAGLHTPNNSAGRQRTALHG